MQNRFERLTGVPEFGPSGRHEKSPPCHVDTKGFFRRFSSGLCRVEDVEAAEKITRLLLLSLTAAVVLFWIAIWLGS